MLSFVVHSPLGLRRYQYRERKSIVYQAANLLDESRPQLSGWPNVKLPASYLITWHRS